MIEFIIGMIFSAIWLLIIVVVWLARMLEDNPNEWDNK